MYNGCYFVYTSDRDLLNNAFVNLGDGHQGYGKADLPKVNITW